MDIFWVKNWTKLGGIYMHFRVFLKVKVQNGDILIFFFSGGGGGLLKFQIYFGVCLIFMIYFGW